MNLWPSLQSMGLARIESGPFRPVVRTCPPPTSPTPADRDTENAQRLTRVEAHLLGGERPARR